MDIENKTARKHKFTASYGTFALTLIDPKELE